MKRKSLVLLLVGLLALTNGCGKTENANIDTKTTNETSTEVQTDVSENTVSNENLIEDRLNGNDITNEADREFIDTVDEQNVLFASFNGKPITQGCAYKRTQMVTFKATPKGNSDESVTVEFYYDYDVKEDAVNGYKLQDVHGEFGYVGTDIYQETNFKWLDVVNEGLVLENNEDMGWNVYKENNDSYLFYSLELYSYNIAGVMRESDNGVYYIIPLRTGRGDDLEAYIYKDTLQLHKLVYLDDADEYVQHLLKGLFDFDVDYEIQFYKNEVVFDETTFGNCEIELPNECVALIDSLKGNE